MTGSLPKGNSPAQDYGLVRLVTSFATKPGEVEHFLATVTGKY